jgi:hypothetical protein
VRVSSRRAGLRLSGIDGVSGLSLGYANGVSLSVTLLSDGDDFCGVASDGSASRGVKVDGLGHRSRAIIRDNRDGSASWVDWLGCLGVNWLGCLRVDWLGGLGVDWGSTGGVDRLGCLGVDWGSAGGVDRRGRSRASFSIASVDGGCHGLRVVRGSQVGRVNRVVTGLANRSRDRNPSVCGLNVSGCNILGRSDFVLGWRGSAGSVSFRVASVLARSHGDSAGYLGSDDLSAVGLCDRANRGGGVGSVLGGRRLH